MTSQVSTPERVQLDVEFRREWAMPNRHTFSIPPIAAFIQKWVSGASVIIDPFAGQSEIASHRNDLGMGGVEATTWLNSLITAGLKADAVLLDPPYSPRQMAECYRSLGLKKGMESTQNARLYKEAKERLAILLKPGGVALTFGWNSAGFGKTLGFQIKEILLVAHGGAHNDTICVAETKCL